MTQQLSIWCYTSCSWAGLIGIGNMQTPAILAHLSCDKQMDLLIHQSLSPHDPSFPRSLSFSNFTNENGLPVIRHGSWRADLHRTAAQGRLGQVATEEFRQTSNLLLLVTYQTGRCSKRAIDCIYAHYDTGYYAAGPIHVARRTSMAMYITCRITYFGQQTVLLP